MWCLCLPGRFLLFPSPFLFPFPSLSSLSFLFFLLPLPLLPLLPLLLLPLPLLLSSRLFLRPSILLLPLLLSCLIRVLIAFRDTGERANQYRDSNDSKVHIIFTHKIQKCSPSHFTFIF